MYLELTQILYDRRISQAKLSRMASINQSDMNSMIKGRRPAFPAWRKRIAEALGVNESILFPEYSGGNKE